jgi:long-subunit acyl-CoA synthetase (AMP-forming)
MGISRSDKKELFVFWFPQPKRQQNPGKTEESFIVIDGLRYFRTGDIGFKRLDYQVEIIDRVKNVFKLAQGEFVTPSKIESALEKSVFVSQICVVGAPKKCPG